MALLSEKKFSKECVRVCVKVIIMNDDNGDDSALVMMLIQTWRRRGRWRTSRSSSTSSSSPTTRPGGTSPALWRCWLVLDNYFTTSFNRNTTSTWRLGILIWANLEKIGIESIESKEAICSSVRVGDDSLVIGILEYLQVNFYNGDYHHDDDDGVPAHLWRTQIMWKSYFLEKKTFVSDDCANL